MKEPRRKERRGLPEAGEGGGGRGETDREQQRKTCYVPISYVDAAERVNSGSGSGTLLHYTTLHSIALYGGVG